MNDTALNVAIETISAAVIVVLIVSQWASPNRRTKINRYFLAILCMMLVMTLVDIAAWLIDEKPGQFYFVLGYTTNFTVYALSAIINLVFVFYMSESIPLGDKAQKATCWVAVLNNGAYLAMLLVSLFNGMIFSIDENNLFHWGAFFWLPHLNAMLNYLLLICVVLISRKTLSRRDMIAYLCYPMIPLLAGFVNLYFYQVTIAWPAMVIALLVVYVNIQMRRERQMREQELTLQNQEMALKISQIQPHFVFNTLAAIRSFIRTNPEQAAMTLDDFSSHLRTMLESPERPNMIRFHDELLNVYTYLSIEKQRFGDRFQVVYDIGERFFFIPLLTLQPIVENAVLHGLTIGKGGTRLAIRTDETPREHIITVADDGNGFDPSAPREDGKIYVGIENVRARLETLCNGQLLIESKPGEGTIAKIIIPKEGGAE